MEKQETFKEVLTNLSEIRFDQLINIEVTDEGFTKLGKIILNSSDSNRRIEEQCEVKFFIRKYMCLKEDLSLKIVNKNHKNICKKLIDRMDVGERTLRKLLLYLYDKHIAFFIVHKEYDKTLYESTVKELKLEDIGIYEEYIYFQILVESVVFPQPAEPSYINDFDKFIRKYQDEIRYFLSIENFTLAISWSNTIKAKLLTMKNDLKKQMTEEIRQKLIPMLKPVLLNKTMALLRKPNKDNKNDYYELNNTVKEYFALFPERDEKYVKISKRYVTSLMILKEFETAQLQVDQLKAITKDDIEVRRLDEELKEHNKKDKNKRKKLILALQKDMTSDLEDSYQWDYAVRSPELKCKLDFSVLNLLK